jgi:hypothetical protein
MSNEDSVQRAVVDQSSEVRDPADDSGLLDDPEAVVETYPKAFDEKIEKAEAAIAAEAGTDHSPMERYRATDNARDNQFEQTQ